MKNNLSLLAAELIEHSEPFLQRRSRMVYAFNHFKINLDDLMKARRACEVCEHYSEKIKENCLACLRTD